MLLHICHIRFAGEIKIVGVVTGMLVISDLAIVELSRRFEIVKLYQRFLDQARDKPRLFVPIFHVRQDLLFVNNLPTERKVLLVVQMKALSSRDWVDPASPLDP